MGYLSDCKIAAIAAKQQFWIMQPILDYGMAMKSKWGVLNWQNIWWKRTPFLGYILRGFPSSRVCAHVHFWQARDGPWNFLVSDAWREGSCVHCLEAIGPFVKCAGNTQEWMGRPLSLAICGYNFWHIFLLLVSFQNAFVVLAKLKID